eukprot:CAMPEP_0113477524 /NCGR_PEP_ID=MMETSP0014_2-20120614/20253_1 /TAXON_ID=2857 /ORGANISM="Nitzschia sp." /LENGTH=833 /DNA_ID=CAMNT_0000370623 /DNA_START=29 /DNA_END=2531 /DNA_ORIENTATION=+ /assembly_acc=CAM_ASM_000159
MSDDHDDGSGNSNRPHPPSPPITPPPPLSGHNRRKTDMDIFVEADDPPSPIETPFVGPLHKGSRRRRRIKKQLPDDEDDDDDVGGAGNGISTGGSPADAPPTAVRKLSLSEEASTSSVSFKIPPTQSEVSRLLGGETDGYGDHDDEHTRIIDDAISNVHTMLETVGESTRAALNQLEEAVEEAYAGYEERRHYNWKEFWKGGNCKDFLQWIVTGQPSAEQSTDEIQENLNSLARMIVLLNEYRDLYGVPKQGGARDQMYVLREVMRDLYAGGCPIWALEPVLKSAAEGLTGKKQVDFFMLPRRTFVYDGDHTSTFSMTRGYDLRRMDDMELIVVRLASFASNTTTSASVPVRWAQPSELRQAFRAETIQHDIERDRMHLTSPEELATEILDLASEAEGLFFFLNAHSAVSLRGNQDDDDVATLKTELGAFWKVDEELRRLFSHLACMEAMHNIDKMDAERKPLYSGRTVTFFRIGAASGACAFWFSGSWLDITVSGLLSVFIAWIGASPLLTRQERIIFEAVASFIVGLVAGLVALAFPSQCCFGAMAISGVLDLLQGFRVVYSIIEIMSRHTVAGGADFLEGIFFTSLIALFLRLGKASSLFFLGEPDSEEYLECNNGVSRWWYFLFVPVAAISWSGLFNPYGIDLPLMALHGILGYLISWQFSLGPFSQIANFAAAVAVTFSAGIVSRFTGRQALGNTVAGIYVLLPGAYLVDKVFEDRVDGFLSAIILRACIIGVGAWTGTVLCSPTLLGRSKASSVGGPSLGAPALTAPLGVQRSSSETSFSEASSPVHVKGMGNGPVTVVPDVGTGAAFWSFEEAVEYISEATACLAF